MVKALAIAFLVCCISNAARSEVEMRATLPQILGRIKAHSFNPGDAMTVDRVLGVPGVADLGDQDWRVRVIAVRDMVRLGENSVPEITGALDHKNPQVRYTAAMSLGIMGAEGAEPRLAALLRDDPLVTVRSQAAISLGQIGMEASLAVLEAARESDPSRDVTHQCELAVHQIVSGKIATDALEEAWRSLDDTTFEVLRVGKPAPDFVLQDTDGDPWRLSANRGRSVALIWVFADWCPVCHGEFRELIEMREAFEGAGIEVVTLEIHDTYRARVMVGKELEPEYWFAKEPFAENYTKNIWWRHLSDRAGAVAASYGVDPFAFAVHGEYINRPSTILIDPDGIVRMAYYGTFWGDRPSIRKMLNMIETDDYVFEHPKRLK